MPAESIALLRSLGDRLVYIHGNGERAVVEAAGAEPSEDELLEQARWCAEQLDAETLAFLAGLPPTARIADTLVCHGTPRSDEEIVTLETSPERLRRLFAGVDAALVVGGHTHSQMERHVDGLRYVNAGSVGMPYENEPGAYWALIAPEVALRRTEYDLGAAAERIRATGFPAAAEFAEEYVLSRHSPDETAPTSSGWLSRKSHAKRTNLPSCRLLLLEAHGHTVPPPSCSLQLSRVTTRTR